MFTSRDAALGISGTHARVFSSKRSRYIWSRTMFTTRMITVFVVLLVAFDIKVVRAAEPKPAPRVAYGDTPDFWETYALVVATVIDVKHRDESLYRVVSDIKLSVQESVPNRFRPGTEFSLTYAIDIHSRPIRDRPGYAVDLGTGDRVMLMMTEEKGKLVDATPRLNVLPDIDPSAFIDLKKGSKPILLVVEFRGISSFAMLPAWSMKYPEKDDAVVAETVRVCQALSEKDVTRRLQLIAALRQTNPNDRVRELLRRRLETTLETSLREAQEATRLLKEVK
jgi:hypothetical protein